jgi:hypothetical protein
MLRVLSVGALIILSVGCAPISEWVKDLRLSGTPKAVVKCSEENDQDFLRPKEVYRACLQRHASLVGAQWIDAVGSMSWAARETPKTVANVEVSNKTKDRVLVGAKGVVSLKNPTAPGVNRHSFDFLVLEPIYPSESGEFNVTLDGFKVGEALNCNDDGALAGECWSWNLDVKYYSLPILSE